MYLLFNMGFSYESVYNIYSQIGLTALIAFPIIFPLLCNNKMSGFRYISLISILSLTYIMIILIMYAPAYFQQNYTPEKLYYAKFDWNFFSSFAITFFSFGCHMEIIPIYNELQEPSTRRISKVIGRTIFINAKYYTIVGLAGYLSTFDETAQIVIERPPLNGMQNDYYLIFGRAIVILVLCIAYPINVIPVK